MLEGLKLLRTTDGGGAPTVEQAVQGLWLRTRRPERHSDFALTGTARLWLRRLPARRRPLRLCSTHPRVANRIAWCWHDVALSAQVIDDLLQDRRGSRRGFAPAIVRELQRLRDFNGHGRVEIRRETLLEALGRIVGLA